MRQLLPDLLEHCWLECWLPKREVSPLEAAVM